MIHLLIYIDTFTHLYMCFFISMFDAGILQGRACETGAAENAAGAGGGGGGGCIP